MRFLRTGFVMLLMLLFAVSGYGETKNKKFAKEEIKKMAGTKAVIETKFGNI